MATVTPNFGWDVPQSTDLVKDGATAIAALGNDIDTSLVDLKGGTTGQVLSKASNTDMDFTWVAQDDSNAIQNALLTTTGDTIYASGASTPARLGIGTTGQVLTVAGGVPSWATPASSGSYTSLASGTLSSTSVTMSSISGTYRNLVLVITNPYVNTGTPLGIRINGSTGADYNGSYDRAQVATRVVAGTSITYWAPGGNNNLDTTAPTTDQFVCVFNEYATANVCKPMFTYSFHLNGDRATFGVFENTTISAAITSITIRTANGTSTFSGGTYTLYGVK